jgi:hypothetical protein
VRTFGEFERDELRKAAARRSKDGLTPQHSAAAAGLEDSGRDGSEPDDSPAAAKAFRDAYEVPAEYPRPIAVHPEDFRQGPIRDGHDAVSPSYGPPLQFPAPPEPRPALAGWSLAGTPSPGPYVGGDCA